MPTIRMDEDIVANKEAIGPFTTLQASIMIGKKAISIPAIIIRSILTPPFFDSFDAKNIYDDERPTESQIIIL